MICQFFEGSGLTASVGKNHATKLFKSLELAVALNRGANLLGTRGDGEQGLCLQAMVHRILSDVGGSAPKN